MCFFCLPLKPSVWYGIYHTGPFVRLSASLAVFYIVCYFWFERSSSPVDHGYQISHQATESAIQNFRTFAVSRESTYVQCNIINNDSKQQKTRYLNAHFRINVRIINNYFRHISLLNTPQ